MDARTEIAHYVEILSGYDGDDTSLLAYLRACGLTILRAQLIFAQVRNVDLGRAKVAVSECGYWTAEMSGSLELHKAAERLFEADLRRYGAAPAECGESGSGV